VAEAVSCRSFRCLRSPRRARCRCCSGTVPNPELHNGQAIQMIDRGTPLGRIQQNLKAPVHEQLHRPGRLQQQPPDFQNDYCGTIGRQFAEGFITGDAITAASIYLTIVAETAFTNTLVRGPCRPRAAANGDFLLPTVFHSVQSDESRHISNGYATLLDGAVGREQPPAARARPALRVVEQPPGGGRGHRHVHRVRHQGPAQRTASPTPRCGAGGSTTTTTAATSYRWRSTAWSSRTTSSRKRGTRSGTRATCTRSRSSSPPAGSPTTGGSTP